MNKKTTLSLFALLIIAVSGSAFAAQGQGTNGQGTNGQGQNGMPSGGMGAGSMQGVGAGTQVQNRLEVQTQNQGEEGQLRVNTQNEVKQQVGANRSENARQHMSDVAKAVQGYLSTGNKTGGIGQQVSEIAKQQEQAQDQIGQALDKIENRKGILKTILGPNFGAVDDMKKFMEQNKLRIQQLQTLKNQTQNQGDDTQLQEMIQSMIEQNTALQNIVTAEEALGSPLGWLIKLFR